MRTNIFAVLLVGLLAGCANTQISKETGSINPYPGERAGEPAPEDQQHIDAARLWTEHPDAGEILDNENGQPSD